MGRTGGREREEEEKGRRREKDGEGGKREESRGEKKGGIKKNT